MGRRQPFAKFGHEPGHARVIVEELGAVGPDAGFEDVHRCKDYTLSGTWTNPAIVY